VIEFFGYDPGAFNEWRLVSLAGWSWWVVLFAALALGAGLFLAYLNLRGAPRRQKLALLALRALGLGLAFLLFLMPGLELSHITRARSEVLVLLDGSASMALPAAIDEEPRWQWLGRFLQGSAPFFAGIGEVHALAPFSFSAEGALAPATLDQAPEPTGDATQVRESLLSLLDRYQDQELGGVLLFSDGADNGGLGALGAEGIPRSDLVDLLRERNIPVHVFLAGVDGSARDLSISALRVDEFAFVHNAIDVEVSLSAMGLPDLKEAPVTLSRSGKPVSSKRVSLDSQGQGSTKFRLVPDALGEVVYEVSVPTVKGEAVEENNRQEFVLKVIRDKIRVLQIVGRPSWDERYLRDLLKRDPNVDLISFFILRGRFDPQPVNDDELSLIPFPTEELFESELPSFDAVIFQNFDYEPYDVAPYLEKVKDYVERGGGLIMVGGDLSFTQGLYEGTPMEEVLPIDLLPPLFDARGEDAAFDSSSFQPVLTERGRRHPVSLLGLDAGAAEERWKKLPPLEGLNLIERAKPGAAVLAIHPTRKLLSGEPAPLLVSDEVKKGRSLALLTDSLWSWAFADRETGGTGDAFRDFWRQAIRWLIKDPELQPLRITTEKDRYTAGETVRVQVRAYLPDYRPASSLEIELTTGAAREERRDATKITTDDDGTAWFEYVPPKTGAQEITAQATLGQRETQASKIFFVEARGDELRDPRPKAGLLRALAEATGGTVTQLPTTLGADEGRALPLKTPRVARVDRRQEEPVWSSWPFLLLPVAALCLEWWLRRRWGHL
jgi:uncharacterized membrane protein